MSRNFLITACFLFLGFSHLFSSTAIPTTRRLLLNKEYSTLGVTLKQGSMDWKINGEEERQLGYLRREERMAVETTQDYPGTGANKNHDPKSPGTP